MASLAVDVSWPVLPPAFRFGVMLCEITQMLESCGGAVEEDDLRDRGNDKSMRIFQDKKFHGVNEKEKS